MTDWMPQIAKIETVKHHPDADTLDVVTVLGDYPVITKRDEYKVGDLAGYIPIDSIVPDTDQFYFLCPKIYIKHEDGTQTQGGPKYPVTGVPEKYRIIKAKKIRGIYSQGMLVALSTIDPYEDMDDDCCLFTREWQVGDSIAERLGLKKWEEPEEENLPNMPRARGINAEKSPEGWKMPHYDVDGIRKYLICLQDGEDIVLTEKIHGSNGGFCHDGTRLWVKSRNYYKKQDEDDMWWDVALRYDLATKLAQFQNLVFFGEVYGQVKGFRYDSIIEGGRLLPRFRVFDIWDTKKLRYLDYDDFVATVKAAGLDQVPELYRGAWLGKEAMYPYAEGQSTLNPKHVREGWVLRTIMERYEPKLDSRMQVKLVGEGYNLQK